MTIPTRDGGTITVTRRGALVDVHVQDRDGRTVATVTRPAGSVGALVPGARLGDVRGTTRKAGRINSRRNALS
ncbi:hypothetical protein [Streptomyces huiliensis]|uniref:hypothetical protein n=1 Tax=Streptomyces huiliensis TaxID=2876027 RepID=UPI001CBF2D5B|nr:hypothetical protein [Streptomyces huiliensis]MBZ4319553.1 hypothetical protein [Streptomyces huiliensis]